VTVRPDGKITIPGRRRDCRRIPQSPRQILQRGQKLVKNLLSRSPCGRSPTVRCAFWRWGSVRVFDLKDERRSSSFFARSAIAGADDERGRRLHWETPRWPTTTRPVLQGKKIKEDFYKLFIIGDTSEDILSRPMTPSSSHRRSTECLCPRRGGQPSLTSNTGRG
jgi:hypothetical protein